MPSRLDDYVAHRLREIRELVRSGATEMTGKVIREGGTGKIVGRFGGGFSKDFPELEHAGLSPGRAAAVIERGRGKPYERLKREARRYLVDKAGFKEPRRRSPGRPTVAPHARILKSCRWCEVLHPRDAHRFHGEGSFHRTHAFSFNPGLFDDAGTIDFPEAERTSDLARSEKEARQHIAGGRRPEQLKETRAFDTTRAEAGPLFRGKGRQRSLLENKPMAPTKIYEHVLSIVAKKGRGHQCSPACRRANHTYIHRFPSRPPMTGSADKQTLMIGKPIGGGVARHNPRVHRAPTRNAPQGYVIRWGKPGSFSQPFTTKAAAEKYLQRSGLRGEVILFRGRK